MNTGHKAYTNESKELSNQIVKEKCNAKQFEHKLTICDFTNWIIDITDCHSGKDYVEKIFLLKGYEICKRKEADHYANVTKKGCDIPTLRFWIRLIK